MTTYIILTRKLIKLVGLIIYNNYVHSNMKTIYTYNIFLKFRYIIIFI